MNSKVEKNWVVRKYTSQDQEKIVSLLEQIFGLSKQHFIWIYENNPAGHAHVWLAEDTARGKIVGSSTFFPWKILVNGAVLVGAQNGNAMTDPEYRGQGIFTSLEMEAKRGLWREGIPITYGFPNEAALPGHRKAGCIEVGLIRKLAKPLNMELVLANWIKNGLLAKSLGFLGNQLLRLFSGDPKRLPDYLVCKQIKVFDERFDDFWRKVSRKHTNIVVRDSQYLNWKYCHNPSWERIKFAIYCVEKGEEVLGFMVLHIAATSVVIVDILAVNEPALEVLLEKATACGHEAKRATVTFAALKKNCYFKIFEKNGFYMRRVKNKEESTFILYLNVTNANPRLLGDPKNWFITMGDHD